MARLVSGEVERWEATSGILDGDVCNSTTEGATVTVKVGVARRLSWKEKGKERKLTHADFFKEYLVEFIK